MDKLFLLDAYALIYRAYYAFIKSPRINSKGFNASLVTMRYMVVPSFLIHKGYSRTRSIGRTQARPMSCVFIISQCADFVNP